MQCVGTAVGSGTLTLLQAVVLGCIAEMVGCLTLGPLVSKSITKGMVVTSKYDDSPELFAFSMMCVLIGEPTITLLATAYGFPISATHGIIGGIVAVGVAAKGPEAVGWSKLGLVAASWVLAPLAGATIALGMYVLTQTLVFRSSDPEKRAKICEPLFLWICFAVNALFIFLKGPTAMRLEVQFAIPVALGVGILLTILAYPIINCSRRRKAATASAPSVVDDKPVTQVTGPAPKVGWDMEGGAPRPTTPDKVARPASPGTGSTRSPDSTPAASMGSSSLGRMVESFSKRLGLDEDLTKEVEVRRFGFRSDDESDADDAAAAAKSGMSPEVRRAEDLFVPVLVVSALCVAVAHGGNDVGNAVGPLAAILAVYETGKVQEKPEIPFWAIVYGTLGFVMGIVLMGRHTIKTVGTKITVLSPSVAFCTQIGGAVAVLASSALGLPVSTSHCLVGAVVGIGSAQQMMGTGKLNPKVLIRIFIAWIVTIPSASAVSLLFFLPFKHFFV